MSIKREYYDSGNLYSEFFEINNKKNGICKKYYETGQIWFIGEYIDDKLNGECKEYNQNGKLRKITNYFDNIQNGCYSSYYDNGLLFEKGQFSNDKRTGEFKQYHYYNLDSDNKLYEICYYIDGKKNGICKCYNIDGIITSSRIYNNNIIDEYTSFAFQ